MRFFKIAIIVILLGLVAGAGYIYSQLSSSLPQTTGSITLTGLKDSVTITRDTHGVPHIAASNAADLAFATGFVHAQDRLWQMEVNRRIGHGRLAEILGADALPIDRAMRTFGFSHVARENFEAINDEAKAGLRSYAAGVNAFLEQNDAPLPPEFIITGHTPEPWQPVDTLVWQKLMWLDLSKNMSQELARAELLTALTPAQVEDLFPTYPGETELPLPALKDIYEELPLAELAQDFAPPKPEGYGSNNWVVSGAHTASGKPLLANDPHLGLTTPSIWYLAHLQNTSDNTNTVGVTFPGSPFVVLGRNDTIAWGFTNTAPDTQDLYVEKILDDDTFLSPDGPWPLRKRDEIIKVKDGETEHLVVRLTDKGPIVSDIYSAVGDKLKDGYALSLKWYALSTEDVTFQSLTSIASADTFDAFKEAVQGYIGPQQNMIYADTSGNIGYYAPGVVPVRHADNAINGRLPSPGWNRLYAWFDTIPYSELPTRYNPASGIIATANERIVDFDYPHFISRDWSLPYRGNRIRNQLSEKAPHTKESFATLQADTMNDMARDILPHLLQALEGDTSVLSAENGVAALQLLRTWDGRMELDQTAPTIFEAWLILYHNALVGDELGDLLERNSTPAVRLIKSSLYWSGSESADVSQPAYYELPPLARERALSWCDNTTTEETETCQQLAVKAFTDALALLAEQKGGDVSAWAWGDVHTLAQTHRPFSNVPGLKGVFELSAPQKGGRYSVNVAGQSANTSRLFSSSFGPSYRGIFDLSDLDQSLFIQPTGQSGHILSNHYSDLFPKWQSGDYITIPTDISALGSNTEVLTLTPAAGE